MAGIDHKDFMHGAALLAIADSPEFTALNRASVKYGHYVVNHDRHVFVKYCDEKRNAAYSFTYTASDKDLFIDGMEQGKCFAVLVCGTEVITGITADELMKLIDLQSDQPEAVRVVVAPGKQPRLRSHRAEVGPIPRNAFPRRILA